MQSASTEFPEPSMQAFAHEVEVGGHEPLVDAEVEAVAADVLGDRELARLVAHPLEGAVLRRERAEERLALDAARLEETVEVVARVLLVLQHERERVRRDDLVLLFLQEMGE